MATATLDDVLQAIRDQTEAVNYRATNPTIDFSTASPAVKTAAVTPSDSTVLNCRALYVGSAGDVAIVGFRDSVAVTLSSVPAGTILPIACRKVMSTNTTASNIVALF